MAQQPNLQSILATLAQFSQIDNSKTQPTDVPLGADAATAKNTSTAVDTNAIAASQNASLSPQACADPRLRGRPQSRPFTPINTPPAKPVVDPATITTWQEGLRCVTKIAAQNKMFEASIKRMMRDQRSHEMRWYSERQALRQSQVSRASSATKALSILQNLSPNGPVTEAVPESEEDKQAELAAFDRKVYKAQALMETSMTAELKGLGVPFFGTPDNLITPDDGSESKDTSRAGGTVMESDLLKLRRKMVSHLEELYRD